MKTFRDVASIRREVERHRRTGHTIGLVPTMGALHEGHLSLVRAARSGHDLVAVSIFVNPLQFGPDEDFTAYPRDESEDFERLGGAGTDIVFIPAVEDMYEAGRSTTVSVGPLAAKFEGAHRPGHFDGVCTIVAKLFNIVRPHGAFFGQKDAQQAAVLKRMVRDLDFDIEIFVCPTMREPDGLALSSRNAYLSDDDRQRATVLYRALVAGRASLLEDGDAAGAESTMNRVFAEAGVAPDYAAACDPDTFEAPSPARSVLLVVAARVGPARLIDNMLISSEELKGVTVRAAGG
jgi:pantoate--beta-alanine ligase